MPIKRLVLDVLTPHEPNVVVYAEQLGQLDKVAGVTVRVVEQDEKTRTVEMVLEGESLPFDRIREVIEGLGGSVHSVDEVSTGSRIVPLQERVRMGE